MFSDKLRANFLTILIKINQSIANLLKELIVLQLGRKLSVFNDTLMLSTEFSKAHNSALRQLSLLHTFARWLLKAQLSNILPLNLQNSNATNNVSD